MQPHLPPLPPAAPKLNLKKTCQEMGPRKAVPRVLQWTPGLWNLGRRSGPAPAAATRLLKTCPRQMPPSRIQLHAKPAQQARQGCRPGSAAAPAAKMANAVAAGQVQLESAGRGGPQRLARTG